MSRLDISAAPESVVDLYELFRSSGFEVLSEKTGGMGGLDIVLAGAMPGMSADVPVFVNFNADRGHWTVAVRIGDMKRWIDVESWKSYLDCVSVDGLTIDEAAAFIKDRIRDMVAAVQ
jgi:hypothetical protein